MILLLFYRLLEWDAQVDFGCSECDSEEAEGEGLTLLADGVTLGCALDLLQSHDQEQKSDSRPSIRGLEIDEKFMFNYHLRDSLAAYVSGHLKANEYQALMSDLAKESPEFHQWLTEMGPKCDKR